MGGVAVGVGAGVGVGVGVGVCVDVGVVLMLGLGAFFLSLVCFFFGVYEVWTFNGAKLTCVAEINL